MLNLLNMLKLYLTGEMFGTQVFVNKQCTCLSTNARQEEVKEIR